MSTITIDRSVVEQALAAFSVATTPLARDRQEVLRAIEELRAALEQPQVEQEPIAWANINKQGDITHTSNKKTAWAKTPLYTHPQPPRQPLTDEEVKAICYTGPVYAPDGKVTRTPEQYKREIADARMHGTRQAERAHGIGGDK